VLARLIVDGMYNYEGFDDTMWEGGNGSMFLEVTPITFHVRVKEGSSLSQLRFFYGKPEQSIVRGRNCMKRCCCGMTADRLMNACVSM